VKKQVAVLTVALCLCGCGIVGKLDAVSNLEASRNSYKECLAAHDPRVNCEIQRAAYRTDLINAEHTPGTLTSWRWL
jgi:hypothetical protein